MAMRSTPSMQWNTGCSHTSQSGNPGGCHPGRLHYTLLTFLLLGSTSIGGSRATAPEEIPKYPFSSGPVPLAQTVPPHPAEVQTLSLGPYASMVSKGAPSP
ncbi:hypothetical protein DPMN_148151 [Dreissena polymorpha]|uniref:Uncharacterized protein n=1 Tax=Dreissena polymorpha TaxID=45954 RepID=A0A9D4J3L1_DREPO|nr:hypothetical protein DPMN_148151 [Dreissena polymorpha]